MARSRELGHPMVHLRRSKAVLGYGAFEAMHRAVHIHTGELCAIKMRR